MNVSGEESKHGIEPSHVLEFIKELADYDKVIVAGLMTMAPLTNDEQVLRKCFRDLKELQNRDPTVQICSCTMYRVIDGNV